MTLSLIVAMAKNRVIGDQGRLPWHISEDLRRFKRLTLGHPVVMGRKTFAAIGGPLPGRENIIITRDKNFSADGVTVVTDPDIIVARARDEHIFIIGGTEIYRVFWPHTATLHLTLVDAEPNGDAVFPVADWTREFTVTERDGPFFTKDDGVSYEFITARRLTSTVP